MGEDDQAVSNHNHPITKININIFKLLHKILKTYCICKERGEMYSYMLSNIKQVAI